MGLCCDVNVILKAIARTMIIFSTDKNKIVCRLQAKNSREANNESVFYAYFIELYSSGQLKTIRLWTENDNMKNKLNYD
jgi:hypothetical protein